MVVPLYSGSGMRIKIIEGMALGKPIVSTPIGTEGISTTSGKDIIVVENAGGFIESVSRLIEDPAFFNEISKNAIDFIHKKFDNFSSAGSLIGFYKTHLQ